MLLKAAAELLSPGGPRARLTVLIFHRVLAAPDPLFPGEPDARRFATILGWVRQWFRVLPLDTALAALAAGELPSRSLAITFDDGYADNHDVALPLLREQGLCATFFVSTGFLDGGRMWNDSLVEAVRRTRRDELDLRDAGVPGVDRLATGSVDQRREAIARLLPAVKYLEPGNRLAVVERVAERAEVVLPTDLMMSSAQVRALRDAGMQIGAHTVSHPILARLPRAQARREIETGRAALEQLLQQRVGLFAYPNGKPGSDYSPADRDLVEELGFDAAVSTAPGAATRATDRWQVPRFTPWDRTPARFGARLLRNLM